MPAPAHPAPELVELAEATSLTVVDTKTWSSPLAKADMTASFSRGFILP